MNTHGFGRFVDHESPHVREEPIHAFYTSRAPRFDCLQRSHKHLIQSQAIGTVLVDDVVGIDHVASRLRHLLAIFTENHALVHQSLEWLAAWCVTAVEVYLVPG